MGRNRETPLQSQPAAGRVYVVGTADTKGEELVHLGALLRAAGCAPLLVDVGIRPPPAPVAAAIDITARRVADHHPAGVDAVFCDDRGRAVAAMGEAFARFLRGPDGQGRPDLAGVIGIGGGGGTSIVTAGLRALPIGVPKLMVSTLASGDVGPYVGVADIAMMPSVVDLAGLNRISRLVLRNAAHAMAGMVRAAPDEAGGAAPGDARRAIGLTMFGVTTPCVTRVAALLRPDFDCLVFHATGTGGRAMEKLLDSGLLTGLVDATTTEICDLLLGGVLSAGEDRLGAVIRTGLPYVGSAGALDMVNFGAPETVPAQYRDRRLYHHNPQVTLMRTTAEECRRIGAWIAARLDRCTGPVRFLLPEGGVSALDAPGQPFHDPVADAALFEAIERGVRPTPGRRILRLPFHINDPDFAAALAGAFREVVR